MAASPVVADDTASDVTAHNVTVHNVIAQDVVAHSVEDVLQLKQWIIAQALELGFSACGVALPDTRDQMGYWQHFLDQQRQADMHWLANHAAIRADPSQLLPGLRSVISVRMDYLPAQPPARHIPDEPDQGIIARYALGRDYHKTLRQRLKMLAMRIEQRTGPFGWRPFADSAPIFEKALAEKAGLGWTGKHTLLLHRDAGSFFVLGELFTTLELPPDQPVTPHCGSCQACLDICPTQAIVAPYQLDAGLCIAYLTIEYQGIIPESLRQPIGNRVFGCDDCQLICPWNRYAQLATVADFQPRHGLDHISLLDLWQWDETTFLDRTAGSPLRRTGYAAFMRNVAIALGNATPSRQVIAALSGRRDQLPELVQIHLDWAISQQQSHLAHND